MVKKRITIQLNRLRRMVIKELLGNELMIHRKDSKEVVTYELVDMKHRINYGEITIKESRKNWFKIIQ